MSPTPQEIMMVKSITESELCDHWEAHAYYSRTGSEAKLKNIPQEHRDKIASFYKECRRLGYYPDKPKDGSMMWLEKVSYDEGWRRSRKLRAMQD